MQEIKYMFYTLYWKCDVLMGGGGAYHLHLEMPPSTCFSKSSVVDTSSLLSSCFPASRKLTARQKELVMEFAKTESLVDGVVQGVGTVQHCSCSPEVYM